MPHGLSRFLGNENCTRYAKVCVYFCCSIKRFPDVQVCCDDCTRSIYKVTRESSFCWINGGALLRHSPLIFFIGLLLLGGICGGSISLMAWFKKIKHSPVGRHSTFRSEKYGRVSMKSLICGHDDSENSQTTKEDSRQKRVTSSLSFTPSSDLVWPVSTLMQSSRSITPQKLPSLLRLPDNPRLPLRKNFTFDDNDKFLEKKKIIRKETMYLRLSVD